MNRSTQDPTRLEKKVKVSTCPKTLLKKYFSPANVGIPVESKIHSTMNTFTLVSVQSTTDTGQRENKHLLRKKFGEFFQFKANKNFPVAVLQSANLHRSTVQMALVESPVALTI
jgi:hypothetical protein